MTNDDIVRMAQKAGMVVVNDQFNLFRVLVRFAALVAAHEREQCAKVCETEGERVDASWVSCAVAIRTRSDT